MMVFRAVLAIVLTFGTITALCIYAAQGNLSMDWDAPKASKRARWSAAIVAVLLFTGTFAVLINAADEQQAPCARYGPTVYIKGIAYRECEERYVPAERPR